MQKYLGSNIWKFYLIAGLGIRFIAPIRILYLLSFGLTFSQIGMMELAAALVIVVLEVPTGVFADLVGRKASRMVAYILSIVAFSCLSFGSTATIFIFGWALSGAADAFQSGAQDALIFDTLKSLGREKEYLPLKSRFLLINTVTVILGSILGAWLYKIDHRLPWYLITVFITLSALVFSTIIEPETNRKFSRFTDRLKEFKLSLKLSMSSLDVRRLIVLGLILTIPMYVFVTLLNQPYLISLGFNVQSLGLVFALITGISGFTASFSHQVEPKIRKRLSFLIIFISFTLLLIFMGLVHSPVALLFVILFYVVENYKNIIIDNYINQSIDSESRATVLSVQSLANNIIISIVFVFVGYFIDILSINIVLILMGVLTGLACIPFISISNRIKTVKLDKISI